MLKVVLKGHDKFYGVSDVIRMFYGLTSEDKDNNQVTAKDGPDIILVNTLEPDGSSFTIRQDTGRKYTYEGVPEEPGREIKRSLYLALSDISGTIMPWGCLTGIRPTLVASEEQSSEELVSKYMVREDKARLGFETAREEMRLLEQIPENDINIYVGVPFCPSRCEYCSFVSQDIGHHLGRLEEYAEALVKEMRSFAPEISRRTASLYMGGGTPTVFDDTVFARIIDVMYETFKPDSECEVTIEAGRPDTITEGKLKTMREHGITRICINPQTMNSTTLARLNRRHSAEDIIRVYEMARQMGFDLINMDLIAGLPYESGEDFVRSTARLIELDPANITIHTLYKKRRAQISRDTVLDAEGERGDIDSAVTRAYEMLYEAGYHPYYLYRQKDTGHGLENTGFAKGDTGCLYNVAMMSDARDVLSFGAGGMSKRCFAQPGKSSKHRVERCPTVKDVLTYIRTSEEAAVRKAEFFR